MTNALLLLILAMTSVSGIRLKGRTDLTEGVPCEGRFQRSAEVGDIRLIKGQTYKGTCESRTTCKTKLGAEFSRNALLHRGNCEKTYLHCCLAGVDQRSISGSISKKTRSRKVSEVDGPSDFDLEEALSEIDGLDQVKKELRDLEASVMLDEHRRSLGIQVPESGAPHMMFVGNPGTGKTKIGKILGELLYNIGMTDQENVVLVKRENLVGSVIGATEKNTLAKIDEAKGGVLFVDEAYQLTKKNSEKDFGKEAVETIMNCLHDNDPVVVFAGYPLEMQRFMDANEGMRRRVGRTFYFEDLSRDSIANIFLKYKLPPFEIESFDLSSEKEMAGAVSYIAKMLTSVSDRQLSMYNAGIADNLIDFLRQEQNGRLKIKLDREHKRAQDLSTQDLMTFTKKDISAALKRVIDSFKSTTAEGEEDQEDQRLNPAIKSPSRVSTGIATGVVP